jgi:hypothetical protein
MVSRSPPFAGLHHGEVIHKVVTQDLRPGELRVGGPAFSAAMPSVRAHLCVPLPTRAARPNTHTHTHTHTGPWPAAASTDLPHDYVPLAEACWARQASARPSATQVLRRLIDMLTAVEEGGEQQA